MRRYYRRQGVRRVLPNRPRQVNQRRASAPNNRGNVPVRQAAMRARRILSDGGSTFCYCRGGFWGQMIQCDSAYCGIIWFHTRCVGLNATNMPGEDAEWICPSCRVRA